MSHSTTALSATRHEAEVGARFDLLHTRFKRAVGGDDVRLRALLDALGPCRGLRVLDLGCGKGRFAAKMAGAGAEVVGLDLSEAMLSDAPDDSFARVRGSARRLPFGSESFDAVAAVEVVEHLPARAVDEVLVEARRVLRPGGLVAVLDKNAGCFDARRPWLPGLAVKWIDERRGRWMYPAGGPVRERWLWPGAFRRSLGRSFEAARVDFLLGPDESQGALFRALPPARRLALWTARKPGGGR